MVILSRTSLSLTVQGDLPGLAQILYSTGATLVLPAGLPGCLLLMTSAELKR